MTQITMLNSMASSDFNESLAIQKSWGISVLDLKNKIFGKSVADLTNKEGHTAMSMIGEQGMSV